MRRLPELLVLAVCVISAAAFTQLPPIVAGDASWLLPFATPARQAPRIFLAFGIPAVLLVLLAAVRWAESARGNAATARALPAWLARPGGRAPEYEKFTGSLDVILLCVVSLVVSIHLGFLASALGWHGPTSLLVGLVFGVVLAAMGNVMPRLRPNPIAGLRTEAMLGDPTAWRNAHASFGRLWVVGGALVIVVALVVPRYSLIAMIAVVMLSLLAAPFLSRHALAKRHDSVP
jgi:hypothetical protein